MVQVRTQATRQILSTQDEVRTAIAEMISRADRGLAILTQDLEPAIYDNDLFLETLKKFILARSFARVRVLIVQPERAMKLGNGFVTMGRRLNSYIEFRHVKPEFREVTEAYCIADDHSIIYRADATRWNGMLANDERAVARTYLERFDALWHACEVEPERRQLHL
jgi:hypothetical protein